MRLAHPDSEQVVSVDEQRAEMYLGNGWRPLPDVALEHDQQSG